MSVFLKSSIGQKFVMSISGLFLIMFLTLHLTLNLLLLDGAESFNAASHFMATNPMIQIMQPILVLGFLFHILYAVILTIGNRKARPIKYAKVNQSESSTFVSRNMFVLGTVILVFLVIHIMNYFWKIKVAGSDLLKEVEVDGVAMENTFNLVSGLFLYSVSGIESYIYSALYVIGGISLGLHLHHGFRSAFQSVGLSNNIWKKRLTVVGDIYAIVIAAGFSIIPIYFVLFY